MIKFGRALNVGLGERWVTTEVKGGVIVSGNLSVWQRLPSISCRLGFIDQ
jgi:hypothetical protein